MSRILALLYGAACYVVFLATFLYAIGFVGNVIVPKTIDSATSTSPAMALLIDALLLAVFAIQHSVMARPAFKRWWTRLVPQAVERSTYVLYASLALILLFWQWRQLPGVLWQVEDAVALQVVWAIFALGWLLVLASTFFINHFDLFGVRQVYLNFKQKMDAPGEFKTTWLYRFVRHPIMLGFIIAFWATPRMTVGHLVFSVGTTVYILIALRFEEHDLSVQYGSVYDAYRKRVPMLLPRLKSQKE